MKTFLIIVFCVLPLCGLIHVLRTYLFARDVVRTSAKIIGYDEVQGEESLLHQYSFGYRARVYRYPIIRFKTQAGTTHTVTLQDERPRGDRTNTNEVTVVYPRENPARARIAHWHARYVLPLFWFAPALAILVVLLLFTLLALGNMHLPEFFNW